MLDDDSTDIGPPGEAELAEAMDAVDLGSTAKEEKVYILLVAIILSCFVSFDVPGVQSQKICIPWYSRKESEVWTYM